MKSEILLNVSFTLRGGSVAARTYPYQSLMMKKILIICNCIYGNSGHELGQQVG